MITFHPAARQVSQPDGSNGFIPMVTLRGTQGRMVGSKVSQGGHVCATASEALEHATAAARRVVSRLEFTRLARA